MEFVLFVRTLVFVLCLVCVAGKLVSLVSGVSVCCVWRDFSCYVCRLLCVCGVCDVCAVFVVCMVVVVYVVCVFF